MKTSQKEEGKSIFKGWKESEERGSTLTDLEREKSLTGCYMGRVNKKTIKGVYIATAESSECCKGSQTIRGALLRTGASGTIFLTPL